MEEIRELILTSIVLIIVSFIFGNNSVLYKSIHGDKDSEEKDIELDYKLLLLENKILKYENEILKKEIENVE